MSRTLTGAEQKRLRAMYVFEQILWGEGCRYVTGIDEAGRGALAGPVVAAAVVFSHPVMIRGLNDSKQLRPAERNRLYSVISVAANGIGIGKSGPDVIDRDNIRQATLQAMAAAVAQLPQTPDHLLIDGLDRIDWPGPQTAVV
ncbi:MAG: ribonuclease HII, partial [candidate division Zixibacteria bacterium]|nr:ribonuclease HII [candidate division Zixibacteria bacterium]